MKHLLVIASMVFVSVCLFSCEKADLDEYFKQSVDRCLNLINRILRRFCRGFGNDLENVRNSLHCVTILSNNPYFAQRYENLFGFQSKFNSLS